ncbi:MAG TPA: lysine transporter LysE, partial [Dissulfuribacter thermophilus]|nr:lysine transporter LysE [Dissulfuribacter thermophilus]
MESDMLEIIGIFGVSFVLALSGALMPGPLLTVTIAESIKKGPWVGPMVILGHGLLELGLVILIVLGLGPYLKTSLVTSSVALIGG